MANCLYVESVAMVYFRRPYPESRKLYGFIVADDYESYDIYGFSNKAEVPECIEKIMRHCNDGENDLAFDLFVQHATADKGVVFDGKFIEASELKRLLELLAKEDEMDPENAR